MFLKLANSDTENGIKENKKCPLKKKSCTAETRKLKKRHFMKCSKIKISLLTNFMLLIVRILYGFFKSL